MPMFEVHLPSVAEATRITAESWMEALREALVRAGEAGVDTRSLMCDVCEDGLRVRCPGDGRTFRVQELGEDGQPLVPKGAKPASELDEGSGEDSSIDDVIGSLIEETQHLYQAKDVRSAAERLLDVAMRFIPSDSGAVFLSDINEQDLYFASARGPKANEVMGYRVPMGQGIVGFCSQQGVALAVADVQNDDRFFQEIAAGTGYATRSLLCSPSQQAGRVFGALELVNKKGGQSFTAQEVNILNFLAHEFADYLVNVGETGA